MGRFWRQKEKLQKNIGTLELMNFDILNEKISEYFIEKQ